MKSKITLLILILIVSSLSAQPNTDWIQIFHNENYDLFFDIYRTDGEGYVMCGYSHVNSVSQDDSAQMWVVKIDNNGSLQWSGTYGEDNIYDEGNSIIETEDGGFLIGGQIGGYPDDYQIGAWYLDTDGNLEWSRTYGQGMCHAVIELKSGEYLLTGGTYRHGVGFLICIDNDGEVLWRRDYETEDGGVIFTMRETEGGVILAGSQTMDDDRRMIWIVKANMEDAGTIIWEQFHAPFDRQRCYSIVSAHDDGFMLAGRGVVNGTWNFMCMKVDDEGNADWSRNYNFEGLGYCLERLPGQGYILTGHYQFQNRQAAAVCIRSNGVERWRQFIGDVVNEGDEVIGQLRSFFSTVIGHDQSILSAGYGEFNEGSRNGVVVKLMREILEPQFISWSPSDTILTVLVGDTVDFAVEVNDDQDDEIDCLWIMGEDTLSRDESAQVVFDQLGEYEVRCFVTDGEFTVSIGWHTTVVEWYIDMFQPDSTEITIRRGSLIDFTHHTRAIEDFEYDYRWEHFGRGGNYEIEGEDSIRFDFYLTGDHLIRAIVNRNNQTESVEWDVNVRSIIWWWWPHENAISVYEDTTMVFEVYPFNEESDSLEHSWSLNDEILESDSTLLEIQFSETGEYEIITYAQEGIEVDTIHWTINVLERSSLVYTNLSDLPTSPVLFPPKPNPFNSSTSISYFLPGQELVSLKVYDISGRQVKCLIEEKQQTGSYRYELNSNEMTAGVYFVCLRLNGYDATQKIIIIK